MSFRSIIEKWPTRADLAADIGRPRVTVQQWWGRDSVPADAFNDIEEAAKKRGIEGATALDLLKALDAKRELRPANDAADAGAGAA